MKTSGGFTLIELLVVVSIILILTVLATVAYDSALNGAKVARARVDLHSINNAVHMHVIDTGVFPSNINQLYNNGYLMDVPKDPWGHSYKLNATHILSLGSDGVSGGTGYGEDITIRYKSNP